MPDNEFEPKKGEKSLLSDMINEYESDNPLRDKIEAAKKRKAMEEEAIKHAEIQRRLDEIQRQKEVSTPKEPQPPVVNEPQTAVPFINADVEATQVFQAEPTSVMDENDKTLVIMDNMKQRDFNAGSDTIYTNQSIQKPEPQPERLAPEFEVEGDTITEQDIEEYLPKDARKSKKPSNPDKMNKIVTYIIAGIAGLCVIGLLVFALNFFGVFGGSGSNKTLKLNEVTIDEKVNFEEIGANNFSLKGAEVTGVTDTTLIKLASAEALSTKDGTKVQVSTVDKSALKETKGTYSVSFSTSKGTKVTVKATVTESKPQETKDPVKEETQKDNSAKKSEIEGQIKSYSDQVANLQTEIATLQNTVNNKDNELNAVEVKYSTELNGAIANETAAATESDAATKALALIDEKKDPEGYKIAKKLADDKLVVYQTRTNELNAVYAKIKAEQDPILTKATEATNSITTKNATVIELQNKIIELKTELANLK